jgi:hypothetical protein
VGAGSTCTRTAVTATTAASPSRTSPASTTYVTRFHREHRHPDGGRPQRRRHAYPARQSR